MGKIELNNIRLYAYHGCLPEEELIGSNYRINLSVKANLEPASKNDDLKDTIDYVHLQNIVIEEMKIRSKLLESVAQRIITRIEKEFKNVTNSSVTVCKINPPIGGDVEEVCVTLSQNRK